MLKFVAALAVLPVLGFAQPASAQQFWWQQNSDAPSAYNGQPRDFDAEATYGPDPYASREDHFDQQQYDMYRREMERRYHRHAAYNQDYAPDDYAPGQGYQIVPPQQDQHAGPYAAPVYPVKPKVVQTKPVVKKVIKPAATPVTTTASSSTTTAPATAPTAPPAATASTTPAAPATPSVASNTQKPAASGPVSCDKGASIVSSFGFDKVTNKTCDGGKLVYSAERGGKPFEIEVNPKSGELTAVKKL